MPYAIIVEGKNDRLKLRELLHPDIAILCTFGTPGTDRVEQLKQEIGERPVFIFTDNDVSGRKIRAILSEAFPDAEHLYTRKEYAGVEGTPEDYLIQRLEKAELDSYVLYPPEFMPPNL